MKTLLFFITAAVMLSFGLNRENKTGFSINKSEGSYNNLFGPSPLALHETGKIKDIQNRENSTGNVDQDWYTAVMENLEKEEYNISYDEELGAYQSPNRANNLRFTYHKDGFTAKILSIEPPQSLPDSKEKELEAEKKENKELDEWEIDFKLSDVKRQTSYVRSEMHYLTNSTNSTDLTNRELSVSGNKAFIEDDNIRIDYTNDKEGMRQDFIIMKKPEGEGKLRLNISADTKLNMIVGADALMFKDKNGIDKMKYSALKCWDANGTELRAYFEDSYKLRVTSYELQNPTDDKKTIRNGKNKIKDESRNLKLVTRNCFSIVVNDEDAVYPVTIDPLSTNPDWIRVGYQFDSQFGSRVSTAGDVNGDGYSDVIVGAYFFDNGETNEGRAYVFLGSSTGLSLNPNWTAESNQTNARFGVSVSTAGDINGDGYSDVIVGANQYDNGQTDEGRAYVYHGSAAGLSVTANWTAESDQQGAQFGYSVSTAGDVNGDGYSDVIVGANLYDSVQINEGRVYVYLGSSTGLSLTPDWTAESNQSQAQFGSSVSTAGDVNGDGYSDVIIGARLFDNGVYTDKGRAYVYHGSASGLSIIEDWTAEINQSNANFGNSVSTAGDVNGDGYSDVIIGAYRFTNGQSNEGRAYLYLGSSTGLQSTSPWGIESNVAEASFGISVSTAGDINGDGYSDVIVGAPGIGSYNVGKIFLYTGSSSGLSTSAVWTYEATVSGNFLGNSVSTAGDVNGDGFSDVITGAWGYNGSIGRSLVFNGSAGGLSLSVPWTMEINTPNAKFGTSVSSAGDVNGDGYSDVIVGAPDFTNGGKVYLYLGTASGPSVTPVWEIQSAVANARLGSSVSTAGDVNGDGYCDVIIGAENLTNGETGEGKAFVYFGTPAGLSPSEGWSMEGNQINAVFGRSVSSAGDVNGDGYSDIIIGAHLYDNGHTDEGKAFVYYGSSTGPSQTPDWTFECNQAGAKLGFSVSTAGDVNGDGFSDVIIAAPEFPFGSVKEGQVYVFNGSSSGLSVTPNWTARSLQANANMGFSVSNAGDVNGDGFSDVIIGAPRFDNGSIDEGLIYVYHGSASGLNTFSSFTAEGNSTSALMGWSVSSAGDVNGDGFSEVIVSLRNFSNGQTNEGAFDLYYGTASSTTETGRTHIESNVAGLHFAECVSSADDVNGDGYSDVIVGVPFHSNGQTNEGRAIVYYGNEKGMKSNVQQYKPGTNEVISSGGLTGTNGQVRLNAFGRSPFGRADGKIVYEYKANGIPNSTSFSGSGNMTDLGTNGIDLSKDISGIPLDKEYKWRARVEYSLVNNPYQKYGPWKYYTSYVPEPFGGFKAQNDPLGQSVKTLSLNMFIQGFFNTSTNLMVPDTITVYLRSSASPFALVDSANALVTSDGDGIFIFHNADNSTPYYIECRHRNSIETWSKTPQQFTASNLAYNFSQSKTTAYGDNLIEVKPAPDATYAIYSGDENQDGFVNLSDVVNVFNNANAFVNGYVASDMNGDDITDLSDIVITFNNASAFVAAIVP